MSKIEEEASRRVKTAFFNFNQIERYFLHADYREAFQVISDRTYQDLDLEEVFKLIDRTVSPVGQQFLYYLMRVIPRGNGRTEKLELLIFLFKQNPALSDTVTKEIARLNRTDAFYITTLFQGEYMQRPAWFWLIKLLSVTSVISVVASLFASKFLIILILLFPINMGIHYWNKNNLYQYGSSIPQLVLLSQIASRILAKAEFKIQNSGIQKSAELLNQLSLQMSVFRIEAKLQSEIGQIVEYILELIKALFLLEPVLLFTTLKKLENRKENIHDVYRFVAEIDVALSVSAFRESVPYYCAPNISNQPKQLNVKDVFHPLIFGGVSNDLSLDQKSALLTGSNMSGKTTFIRTIGINAILGQTINTCLASKFEMPALKIHSAIRISDDLLNNKSYYFEEVLILKQLLSESQSGEACMFLLDELFKGTNSIERIAIGKSVLEYLIQANNIVLVSTHDRELADYLDDSFKLHHFTEIIEGDQIVFDYKIKAGKLTTTNAIRILDINGYPDEVVAEALRLSTQMQNQGYKL